MPLCLHPSSSSLYSPDKTLKIYPNIKNTRVNKRRSTTSSSSRRPFICLCRLIEGGFDQSRAGQTHKTGIIRYRLTSGGLKMQCTAIATLCTSRFSFRHFYLFSFTSCVRSSWHVQWKHVISYIITLRLCHLLQSDVTRTAAESQHGTRDGQLCRGSTVHTHYPALTTSLLTPEQLQTSRENEVL